MLTVEELQRACLKEQRAISDWWLAHAIDHRRGGFLGAIDIDNRAEANAIKGAVQNTRILWYFSEAALFSGRSDELEAAHRAYHYFINHFVDQEYGGILWSLDSDGNVLNDRKQIYAQAFGIYALTAYARLSGDRHALKLAETLFDLVEQYGADPEYGGYWEAFDRQWQPIDDLRLSPKDPNWSKTMNTHLHVMEAYTQLLKHAPDHKVDQALQNLVRCFQQKMISSEFHLRAFFDFDWQDQTRHHSYGHDIECSWLLWEAVQALRDPALEATIKPLVTGIATTCLHEGTGSHGELFDGYDCAQKQLMTERVWWIQAEAMVGYLNAFELTENPQFLQATKNAWQFIENYHIDVNHGEWLWLSRLDSSTRFNDHKAGFWKGPYHNGRAMIEICRRLQRIKTPGKA